MLFYIMSNTEILRLIRHSRYFDLGNGSNKLGNHCTNPFDVDLESEMNTTI